MVLAFPEQLVPEAEGLDVWRLKMAMGVNSHPELKPGVSEIEGAS